MQLTFAQDWLDRIFGHHEEIELPYPTLVVGDCVYIGEAEIEVCSIETPTFYIIPAEWTEYADELDWAYCWDKTYGMTSWIPVVAIVEAIVRSDG